jgi:DNA repair protein RadC
MGRYEPVGETILLMNPKTGDLLVLVDEEEIELNPARRKKTLKVELPLGKYEDLRVRTALVRSHLHGRYESVQVTSSADVYKVLKDAAQLPQESIFVILLDARNKITGVHEVAIGTWTHAVTAAGPIFQAAIVANAPAIILVHNHPSGNLTESVQDVSLANNVKRAGDILGIKLLDSIIIADEGWLSLADKGLM